MQKLRLFGMNGVLALILACTAGVARGQQAGYLILIDAENKQPFTARIGESLMQSTVHGHLLISQLRDSIYRVAIRFPHSPVPDQVFPVNIRKKDLGLQLKDADGSWILYNWQSKETIRPLKEVDSSRLLDQGIRREDGFSSLMAAVVNDTSVMYTTFTWNNLSKDSLKGLPGRDSVGLLAANRATPPSGSATVKNSKKKISAPPSDSAAIVRNSKAPVPDTVKSKEIAKAVSPGSEVKKLREVSLKISRKMVYQDISPEGEKDTITLFVYFETSAPPAKKRHEDPMVTARRLLRNDTSQKKPDRPEKEMHAAVEKQLVRNGGNDSLKKDQETVKADMHETVLRPVAACTQEATEADMTALRSAILVRNTDQEKISVSAGAFAMKCFSVVQVRQLAELFISDKARYQFLQAAHGHVADGDHFPELADLLVDTTYVKKFRTLVHKRG